MSVNDLVFRLRVEGADAVRRELEQVRAAAQTTAATTTGQQDDNPRLTQRQQALRDVISGQSVATPAAPRGTLSATAQDVAGRYARTIADRDFRRNPSELSLLDLVEATHQQTEIRAQRNEQARRDRLRQVEQERQRSVDAAQEVLSGQTPTLQPLAQAQRLHAGGRAAQALGGVGNENLAQSMFALEREIREQVRQTEVQNRLTQQGQQRQGQAPARDDQATREARQQADRQRLIAAAQEIYQGGGQDLHPLARATRLGAGARVLQAEGGRENENLAGSMKSLETEIRNSFKVAQQQAGLNPLEQALARSNERGWQYALAGLTFQFGAIPLFQFQDQAREAGRAYTGLNPDRSELDIRGQASLGRLGAQGEGAQQNLDRLGQSLTQGAERLGLGGALPYATAGVQTLANAANLASVVVALTGLIPTTTANTGATTANTMALNSLTSAMLGRGGPGAAGPPVPGGSQGQTRPGQSTGGTGTGPVTPPVPVPSSPQAPRTPAPTPGGGPVAGGAAQLTRIAPWVAAAFGLGELASGAFGGGSLPRRGPWGDATEGPWAGSPQIPQIFRRREQPEAPRAISGLIGPQLPEGEIIAGRTIFEARQAASDPRVRETSFRLRVEESRQQADPYGVAAQREIVSDLDQERQFAQRRRSIAEARQDESRQRIRFDENQETERRQLDLGFGRQTRDIETQYGYNETRLTTSRDRQRRDLQTRIADQREDLRTRATDSREDVQTRFTRSERDIGVASQHGVEDVNLGFVRGIRNTILSQAFGGGLGGAIIQQVISRNDNLQDISRNAQRQRARAGLARDDSLDDIAQGERRAERDVQTGERRGGRDIDQGVKDARDDNLTARTQAIAEATKRYTDALEDLAKAQNREKTRFEEDAQIRTRARQQAQEDLDFAEEMQKKRKSGLDEEIKARTDHNKHLADAARLAEGLARDLERIQNKWAGVT